MPRIWNFLSPPLHRSRISFGADLAHLALTLSDLVLRIPGNLVAVGPLHTCQAGVAKLLVHSWLILPDVILSFSQAAKSVDLYKI